MNRLRPWLVVGTALLMVGGLNLLILSEYRARAEGTPIRLAIEGIDPRSPLSGHYVQLRFTEPLPKGVGCSSMLRRQRDAQWIALRTCCVPRGWRDRLGVACGIAWLEARRCL